MNQESFAFSDGSVKSTDLLSRPGLSVELQRQFCLISECEIEGKADLYFELIERRGESVETLVIDAFDLAIADKLWKQSVYLVSAARQLKISQFCLVRYQGHNYGFTSRSL